MSFSASFLNAATITKNDLLDVPPEKKDQIFAAFSQVILHYLVTADGGSVIQEYDHTFPALIPEAPKDPVITFYYSPHIAENIRKSYELQEGVAYNIRKTTLENVLHWQYSMLGKTSSFDSGEFDFIVIDDLHYPPAFAEYLEDVTTRNLLALELPERNITYIPVYMARNIDAIRDQEDAKSQGYNYKRVAQNFPSILKLVEEFVGTETPVFAFFGESDVFLQNSSFNGADFDGQSLSQEDKGFVRSSSNLLLFILIAFVCIVGGYLAWLYFIEGKSKVVDKAEQLNSQSTTDSSSDTRQTSIGDAAISMVIPYKTSLLSVIAGYAGLFSILIIPAPVAIIMGILAIRDLKKHPEKRGMGRAVFAIVMGITIPLIYIIWARMDG